MNHCFDYYNPYPSFRTGQSEQINNVIDAYNSGYKACTLKVPTAGGKSLTGYILMNKFAEGYLAEYDFKSKYDKDAQLQRALYTTPQINLVEQLRGNTLFKMPVIIGKSNYECSVFHGYNADDCPYENSKSPHAKCKSCVYKMDKYLFNNSCIGAETFDRFYLDANTRANTKFLFIDESATLFDCLVSKSELRLPEIIVGEDGLFQELNKYFKLIVERTISLKETYDKARKALGDSTDKKLANDAKQAKRAYNASYNEQKRVANVLNYLNRSIPYVIYDKEDIIFDRSTKEKTSIVRKYFKLLDAKYIFEDMITGMDFVVLASGTPSSELVVPNKIRHCYINMPHPIDVSQRLVYYHKNVGSGKAASRKISAPNAAYKIMELHNKYNKHTIVHCGTYEYAQLIYNELTDLHPNVVLQKEGHREECLSMWQSIPDSIFLSVKFTDGLDLAGPEYPIGIIAGLNFPNIGDAWISKRNKLDNSQWYNIQVANSIIQACGRNTRNEKDFGEVHIIDNSFGRHYGQHKNSYYNYDWFKEAIRYVQ
jgi:Rad3-related DNA helicase